MATNKQRIQAYVDQELFEAFATECADWGVSQSQALERILTERYSTKEIKTAFDYPIERDRLTRLETEYRGMVVLNTSRFEQIYSRLDGLEGAISQLFREYPENFADLNSNLDSELSSESLGEDSSDLASELSSGSLGEDSSDLASELSSESLGEDSSDLASELSSESLAEDNSDLASELSSELSSESLAEDNSDLASELSSKSLGEDSSDLASELSSESLGEDSSDLASELASESLAEDGSESDSELDGESTSIDPEKVYVICLFNSLPPADPNQLDYYGGRKKKRFYPSLNIATKYKSLKVAHKQAEKLKSSGDYPSEAGWEVRIQNLAFFEQKEKERKESEHDQISTQRTTATTSAVAETEDRANAIAETEDREMEAENG